MPVNRPGLGDTTERLVSLPHGYIEYRFTPAYGIEIVNIEVSNEHRREGVGRQLLRQLFQIAFANDVVSVYAITRSDNRIAQEFYESCGFLLSGRLLAFYSSTARIPDAYIYCRSPKGPV